MPALTSLMLDFSKPIASQDRRQGRDSSNELNLISFMDSGS